MLNRKKRMLRRNVETHDGVAQQYDAAHVEIYNPVEQKRLDDSLRLAFDQIRTGSTLPVVLDFGAGTGNITSHLVNWQCDVVAADVSAGSLERLKNKFRQADTLRTLVLNGEDLSSIPDDTFDMVASYSVIHHLDDYLRIVEEFVRVLKPGGIVYIDHEACPSYWEANACYLEYLDELGPGFLQTHCLELGIPNPTMDPLRNRIAGMKRAIVRREYLRHILWKLNLVYDEGDLHVTREDHVEWGAIKANLAISCEILLEKDYLACRERAQEAPVWSKWMNRCSDMRFIVGRKKGAENR